MRRALLGLICVFYAAPVIAEIKVTPLQLRETRVVELSKPDPKKPQFFNESRLEITLQLSGPEAADATEYQRPKVTEAVDDSGASLVLEDKFGSSFQPVFRNKFGRGGDEAKDTGEFDVGVSLKAPSRKATALKSVKGTIAVRTGGEKKEVVVKNPSAMAGKAIENAELAALKLSVTVNKDQKPGALSLEIVGDRTPIKSIDVLDAAGKEVSGGHSAFGFNNKTTYDVMMRKPLDETMSLKVNLLVGQKVVEVPFELKDVALP